MDAIIWLPGGDIFDIARIRSLVEPALEGAWKVTPKKDRITFRQGTWFMSFRLEQGESVAALRDHAAKTLGLDLGVGEQRIVQRAQWTSDLDRLNDVLIGLECFQKITGTVVVQGSGAKQRVLRRP